MCCDLSCFFFVALDRRPPGQRALFFAVLCVTVEDPTNAQATKEKEGWLEEAEAGAGEKRRAQTASALLARARKNWNKINCCHAARCMGQLMLCRSSFAER